ncbi:MAG: hypothetical protein ACYTF8_12000 [Planctomycetota bacterium]|jgi:hypothetical protein
MARITFLLAGLLLLVACQTSAKPDRLLEQVEDPRITERELRLRVFEYAREFGAVVEAAGTEIAESTNDGQVSRRALLWQMTVIPVCFAAASHDDAVAGLLDVWALTVQMRIYLEEGDGREAFGDFQSLAVDAARELERLVDQLADSIPASGEAVRGRELVHDWVAEHPMRGPLFARPSTSAHVATMTRESGLGTFGAVRKMEEHLGAISERMSLYVEHLPRQARWQAAFLLLHFLDTEAVASAMENIHQLSVSLDKFERRFDELPDLVTSERKVVVAVLQQERELVMSEATTLIGAEREKVLKEVDRQRELAFAAVREERQAVMKEVGELQQATVAVLRDERKIVLDAVHQERLETMDRVEAITRTAVDDAMTRAEGLVDYVLWRAIPFGGLALALVLGIVFWMRRSRYGAR